VALCDVLGRPDLASHPNLVTNAKRVEHREALTRVLEARFADYETEPLLDALHERNIPTGIVNDVPAVFDQPTAQKMTTDPENGPSGLRQTAFPHPDGTAPPLAPPPHCAEHTTAILRDHLGFSQERIESLAKNEILVR
jgi:crotonobetainyl-CoA:carnitine CoA-transferase CaiB-like acyl-CoA transferase